MSYDTSPFSFFGPLNQETNSRGRLLEHLESFGTKFLMIGPIILQILGRHRETNKDP